MATARVPAAFASLACAFFAILLAHGRPRWREALFAALALVAFSLVTIAAAAPDEAVAVAERAYARWAMGLSDALPPLDALR